MNLKTTNFLETIKKICALKRTRITLYMTAVLWLAVVTQIIVNSGFKDNFQITEAFTKTDMQEMESSIEIVAEYNKNLASERDKKSIIFQVADAIGLSVDKEIKKAKDNKRTEYAFSKKAKQAATEIKVISMERQKKQSLKVKHYIIVRLSVMQSIQNIERYKRVIENTLHKIGVENTQITMKFEGSYEGVRSNREKRKVSEYLVEGLQGKMAMEYEESNLYTVYAYSGLIPEYIETMGSKVNIQIAISYDELADKTKVILATPILNQGW